MSVCHYFSLSKSGAGNERLSWSDSQLWVPTTFSLCKDERHVPTFAKTILYRERAQYWKDKIMANLLLGMRWLYLQEQMKGHEQFWILPCLHHHPQLQRKSLSSVLTTAAHSHLICLSPRLVAGCILHGVQASWRKELSLTYLMISLWA